MYKLIAVYAIQKNTFYTPNKLYNKIRLYVFHFLRSIFQVAKTYESQHTYAPTARFPLFSFEDFRYAGGILFSYGRERSKIAVQKNHKIVVARTCEKRYCFILLQ